MVACVEKMDATRPSVDWVFGRASTFHHRHLASALVLGRCCRALFCHLPALSNAHLASALPRPRAPSFHERDGEDRSRVLPLRCCVWRCDRLALRLVHPPRLRAHWCPEVSHGSWTPDRGDRN